MIVQCPACSTKFSVDNEKVGKLLKPKFHCSRCDHYFELHSKKKAAAPSVEAAASQQLELLGKETLNAMLTEKGASSSALSDGVAAAWSSPGESGSLATESRSLPTKSWSSAKESWATKPLFHTPSEPAPSENVTARWPDSLPSSTFEADMRNVLDQMGESARRLFGQPANSAPSVRVEPSLQPDVSAPVVNEVQIPVINFSAEKTVLSGKAESWSFEDEEPLAVMKSGRFTPLIETKTQMLSIDDVDEFTLGDLPPVVEPQSARGPQLALISSAKKRSVIEEGTALPADSAGLKSSGQKKPGSKKVAPVSKGDVSGGWTRLSGWSGVGVALSFPILLTAALGAWSVSFSYTPEALAAATRLDGADMPRVAPTGLDILSTQSEWVGLDKGERVFQVKGTIVNSTDRAYRDIAVEVKLFDRENTNLGALVVPAANGISGMGSVMALTPDTIEELQAKAGVSRVLRTGEQLPFRVIVTSADEKVAWFSVRVYSVRRSPTA